MLMLLIIIGAAAAVGVAFTESRFRERHAAWMELEQRYGPRRASQGKAWTFTAQLPRDEPLEHVLVVADERGLYLYVSGPMPFVRRGVLIPWREIEVRDRNWDAGKGATLFVGLRHDQLKLTAPGASHGTAAFSEFSEHVLACHDKASSSNDAPVTQVATRSR